jgi:glycine/D-amino acid oxidase-like deaminating enzyme
LGLHPEYPKIAIANGLGAKGYMLAPLLMNELVQHLFEGKEIPKDSHIGRFAYPKHS